jgi:hypothetical protein
MGMRFDGRCTSRKADSNVRRAKWIKNMAQHAERIEKRVKSGDSELNTKTVAVIE